jgi:hypothetical protein
MPLHDDPPAFVLLGILDICRMEPVNLAKDSRMEKTPSKVDRSGARFSGKKRIGKLPVFLYFTVKY